MAQRLFKTYSFLVIKFSTFPLYAIGVFFSLKILTNSKSDTTAITNAAFVIVASLASICFALARSLENEDKHRDKFTYCGERFFHAGILLITASVLKYAILYLASGEYSDKVSLLVELCKSFVSAIVSLLFPLAIWFACQAVTICNEILWARAYRYPLPNWNDIIE